VRDDFAVHGWGFDGVPVMLLITNICCVICKVSSHSMTCIRCSLLVVLSNVDTVCHVTLVLTMWMQVYKTVGISRNIAMQKLTRVC
jgi:hypothetical protein